MDMEFVEIDGFTMNVEMFYGIVVKRKKVKISGKTMENIQKSRNSLQKQITILIK